MVLARVLAAVIVTVVSATGCGSDRYDGPLDVSGKDDTLPEELADTGAAGRSLRCDHEYYSTGPTEERFPTGGSPHGALRAYAEDRFGIVPTTGFELVREDEDRALFVYDVDGETKAAVVVARQGNGRWLKESVATCDPAEFAPSADADVGFEIWTDGDGNRVPIQELLFSRRGPEHCGWESASFIGFDIRSKQWTDYVRDPEGVLTDWTRGSYAADVELPANAKDSGYRHDDWQLWHAANRSAVYVVTPDHIERWPRAKERIGCA